MFNRLNKLMANTAIDNNVRPCVTASGFLNRSETDFEVPSRCLTNDEFDFADPSGSFNNGDFNDDDPSGFLNNNGFGSDFVTPNGFYNHSENSTPPTGSTTSSGGYSTPPSDFGTPSKVVKRGQVTVQDNVTDPGLKSIRASNQAFLASLAREYRGAVAQLGQAAKSQGISPAHLQWILTEESEKMTKIDKTSNDDIHHAVEIMTVEDDDVDDLDEDEDENEDMNLDEEDDDDEDADYQGYM